MNNKLVSFLIGAAVIVGSIVGIGFFVSSHQNKKTADQPNTSNAVMTNTVEISGYAFKPASITVKKGTKVTWTNKDSVEHTVTSQSGAPASIKSGLFGMGKSFSFTFDKTGTYEYSCDPHPYMKGTVVVTN